MTVVEETEEDEEEQKHVLMRCLERARLRRRQRSQDERQRAERRSVCPTCRTSRCCCESSLEKPWTHCVSRSEGSGGEQETAAGPQAPPDVIRTGRQLIVTDLSSCVMTQRNDADVVRIGCGAASRPAGACASDVAHWIGGCASLQQALSAARALVESGALQARQEDAYAFLHCAVSSGFMEATLHLAEADAGRGEPSAVTDAVWRAAEAKCRWLQAPEVEVRCGLAGRMDSGRRQYVESLLRAWNVADLGTQESCPCCHTVTERVAGCMHVCCGVCGAHYCYLCRRVYPQSHNPNGRELHDLMVRSDRIHLYRSFALGMDQMRCLEGASTRVNEKTKHADFETAKTEHPELWTLLNLNHADRFSHNTPPFYYANCPQYMFDVCDDEFHCKYGLYAPSAGGQALLQALGAMRLKWKLTADELELYDVESDGAERAAREKGMQMMYKALVTVHRYYSILSDDCDRERSSTAFVDLCRFMSVLQSALASAGARCAGGGGAMESSVEQVRAMDRCGWNATTALAVIGRERVRALCTVMVMSGTPQAMLDIFQAHGEECVEPAYARSIYTYAGVAKHTTPSRMLKHEHALTFQRRSLEDRCRRHSIIDSDELEEHDTEDAESHGVGEE